MIKLHRLTFFVFLFPRLFLNEDSAEDLDIEEWSDDFTWTQDRWNGLLDIATPVPETIVKKEGDCEDYALVVASWATANNLPARIGFCFEGWRPKHVIAEVEKEVYSSGIIFHKDAREYLKWSEYDSGIIIRI